MNAEKEEFLIHMMLNYAELRYNMDTIQEKQNRALNLMEQEIYEEIKEAK